MNMCVLTVEKIEKSEGKLNCYPLNYRPEKSS